MHMWVEYGIIFIICLDAAADTFIYERDYLQNWY